MGKREQIEATQKRKQELVDQLAISREAVSMSKALVKDGANLKKNLMRTVNKNPKPVMIGSAVFGLIAATLLKRKKKYISLDSGKLKIQRAKRSWISRILIGLATKKVKSIAMNKARDIVVHKLQSKQQYPNS